MLYHVRNILTSCSIRNGFEIGAGTGRHLTGIAPLFDRYTALEPQVPLLNQMDLPIPENVVLLNRRFPEGYSSTEEVDTLLAFWADVPIHVFEQEIRHRGIDNAIWIMNGTHGELSNLWPEGARKAWGRRAAWLESNGFKRVDIDSEVSFPCISEMRTVMRALLGEAVDLPIKNSLSQHIVLLYRSSTN